MTSRDWSTLSSGCLLYPCSAAQINLTRNGLSEIVGFATCGQQTISASTARNATVDFQENVSNAIVAPARPHRLKLEFLPTFLYANETMVIWLPFKVGHWPCSTSKPSSLPDMGPISHHSFSLLRLRPSVNTAWTLFAHPSCATSKGPSMLHLPSCQQSGPLKEGNAAHVGMSFLVTTYASPIGILRLVCTTSYIPAFKRSN